MGSGSPLSFALKTADQRRHLSRLRSSGGYPSAPCPDDSSWPSPINWAIAAKSVSNTFPSASTCHISIGCGRLSYFQDGYFELVSNGGFGIGGSAHWLVWPLTADDAVGYLAGVAGLYQRLHDLRLYRVSRQNLESVRGDGRFHSLLVGSVDRHRVERVSDRNDLCLQRYLLTGQPLRDNPYR